jgi:hypothetical protein
MIALHPVESSQIAAAGFDPVTGTLALQFKQKGGLSSVYHYPNWTQEKHDAFLASASLGKHFGKHIKGNADHPHTKVVPEKQDSGDA